jgi:acetylornithine deacetylase/succinyl-diaminopimelate desuccinylase-like protein
MNAQRIKKELITLTKLLIQTPSPSGHEKDVANIIAHEMKRLQYNEVIIDDIGNVIGIIKGDILFTTHMDHVPPGEREKWLFDPFEGVIEDDYIYGCGAADAKGPLVIQLLRKHV